MAGERLAQMPRGAYLVNTSRGGVIDEAALAAPNLIVTPHVTGISLGSQAAMLTMACQGVARRLRGERPAGLVNPAVLERSAH